MEIHLLSIYKAVHGVVTCEIQFNGTTENVVCFKMN